MIEARGVRIGWADLPAHVQNAVAAVLGSPVVRACSQSGGFSPGSADRVVTRDGRRAFVKAASVEQNERTVELHRREARVVARLPRTVPAPTLLGVHDDGTWIALIFEDVDGRTPRTPWVGAEIDAVVTALAEVSAAAPFDPSVPAAADELAPDLAGWTRVARDVPPGLDDWVRSHLDLLRELSAHAVGLLVGEHLMHTDVRADNLLLRPDGRVAVVDWPWATRGPAWLDVLQLMVNVNLYGGHDVDQLTAAHVHAGPGDVTAMLAAFAGYFVDAARKPPSRGLPTVRAFQAAQGERTLAWVRRRLEGD